MDESDLINELSEQGDNLQKKNTELATALASSSYQSQEQDHIIAYQLDHGEMLARIEHFIRGDVMKVGEEGSEEWHKQTDTSLIFFNEYGVNSIMSIISNYLDKNTVLSTYDEMRINHILADLGDELATFIYCNYEKMGMDTEFKKTRYVLVVLNILHTIESTYRRAIGGQTREDINSAKIFTQSDFSGMPRGNKMQSGPSKFNLFKPGTW